MHFLFESHQKGAKSNVLGQKSQRELSEVLEVESLGSNIDGSEIESLINSDELLNNVVMEINHTESYGKTQKIRDEGFD